MFKHAEHAVMRIVKLNLNTECYISSIKITKRVMIMT